MRQFFLVLQSLYLIVAIAFFIVLGYWYWLTIATLTAQVVFYIWWTLDSDKKIEKLERELKNVPTIREAGVVVFPDY